MTTKQCSQCKTIKNFSDFQLHKTSKYGVSSKCKLCINSNYHANKTVKLAYYIKNKERIEAYRKEYNNINRDRINKHSREYARANKETISIKQKIYMQTDRAKMGRRNSLAKRRIRMMRGNLQMNMSHPLSKELIELLELQDYKCNLCACNIRDKHHLDHHVPLSKGGTHTLDNVVFLCPTCNIVKSNKMPETLLLI